jgi:hypothetical protein
MDAPSDAVGDGPPADAQGDATSDSQTADAPPDCGHDTDLALDAFAPGSGSFLCSPGSALGPDADIWCDRSTQYCRVYVGYAECLAFDERCKVYTAGGCCISACFDPLPGACDGGPLRCACLTGAVYCADDDAGGLTASCHL